MYTFNSCIKLIASFKCTNQENKINQVFQEWMKVAMTELEKNHKPHCSQSLTTVQQRKATSREINNQGQSESE